MCLISKWWHQVSKFNYLILQLELNCYVNKTLLHLNVPSKPKRLNTPNTLLSSNQHKYNFALCQNSDTAEMKKLRYDFEV